MAFKDFMHTVKSEANDAMEVTKLKSKISKEKTLIKDDYQKIGEIVYKRYENGCDDAELASIVTEITEAKGRIAQFNAEIEKVRMN